MSSLKHAALAVALFFAASAESGGAETKACQSFIASLPSDYKHGFVSVPENSEDPNSPTLQIFYYGKLIAGHAPVVVFNGGPTSNSWGDYSVLHSLTKEPLIFIDQRGTGCSSPYPEVKTQDDLPRLAFYGSTEIVSDAEAVRKTLIGESPWKIFGQSYGGMIVHRYVTTSPNSIISATSHGFALTRDLFNTLAARIESQNRIVQTYLSQYPGDAATLSLLDQETQPERCFSPTQGEGQSCGKNILKPFYLTLGFVDQWPWIHRWLSEMQTNGGISQAWLDEVVFNPNQARSKTEIYADKVIWHTEMNFALNNTADCEEVYSMLEAKGETPKSWYLNECQPAVERPIADDPLLDDLLTFPRYPIQPEDFAESLKTHPNLAFYLYSGELDPYSPVAIFQEELEAAGSLLHYTNFTHSGHDGFYTEPLVWQSL